MSNRVLEKDAPGEAEPRWEQIAEQIRLGDSAGMEALYEAFGRGLRFYFLQQLSIEDVDDMIHDAFVAVVTKIRAGAVLEPARLGGYVRGIAHNQVASYISEKIRRRVHAVELTPLLPLTEPGPSPEKATIQRQLQQFAQRVLSAMPLIDRQILIRFYQWEQSAEQICEELRLSPTQFRLRKSRAKERFSGLLRKQVKRDKLGPELFLRKKAASGH